ncbi:MAG: hypothetical protein A3K60_07585 [Euryarchaeota archaeon RBG_19FT_COMBO_56_21]|nr:MAG: hypothetical protein A3K60_07585 [Euryarchaeota archaeon RBG_19FT_COMBO_56_21]
MLIVSAFIASAVPAAVFDSPVTGNAAAVRYEVKLGMLQDVENWNPLNPELVSDYVMVYLMFSVLFQYSEDWTGPVNDLATDHYQVNNPNGTMSTYINITQNAYFRNKVNPSDTSHPLTAEDVRYSIQLVLDHPGGAWDEYLTNITAVEALDSDTVHIMTDFPKSTLIDNLVWIPILPKYQWSAYRDNQILTAKSPAELIGSGPFMFNNTQDGYWYRFDRAANYHGAVDYPVGTPDPNGDRVVKVDGLLYTVYTEPSGMVLDMNSGSLDAIDLAGSPNLYLNELGQGNSYITKFATQEMGIIDIAVNAIPMEFRSGAYATGNELLLDPIVRQAIGMTLNKQEIADTIMFGLAGTADSVLSPGYWHKDITNELTYDPAGARALLLANGYADNNGDGVLEATATAYPVQQGWASAGSPLSFRLTAPDTDPVYDSIGRNWVSWAAPAGIDFNYLLKTEKTMIFNDWYQADYDIWVWAWYWGPEPLSNLGVWQTKQIRKGGDNCQMPMGDWWYMVDTKARLGYSSFDENYSKAQREFDPVTKKAIIDLLQQQIHDSWTELPPIYPVGLWGVSEKRFTGWGNWTQHIGRSFESDLPWLWFDVTPLVGVNMNPEFDTPVKPTYQIILGDSETFTITVHDPEGDPLTVTWDFGDGSPTKSNSSTIGTSSPTTFTQDYTYTALSPAGSYFELVVNVSDGNLGNNAIGRAHVYVIPHQETVPQLTFPILSDPIDRAYVDQLVTWTAGAMDAESGGPDGFGLQFTWAWNDGAYNISIHKPTVNSTEVMDTATHAWSVPSTAGTYDVELFVWDGSELPGHNVSLGVIPFEVIVNEPPTDPIISNITANRNVLVSCVATSSDPDPDILRFTWEWDDGTFDVTEATVAPGTTAVSMVDHTWSAAGTYPVTVYVDDLTGDAGHNVSASIDVVILNTVAAAPPSALLLLPRPEFSSPDEVVTLNASAVDTNTDTMTFYIEFGDGNVSSADTVGGTTSRQYIDFTHAYADEGSYKVTLWADDGDAGHNMSTNATVVVTANSPPWLILSSEASAYYNRTFILTPARVRDNDSDTLQVWYDWGDGTNISAGSAAPLYQGNHTYTSMTNKTVTVYVDDGTGLDGHNVSGTIVVSMNENLRPTIVGTVTVSPAKALYSPDEEIKLNITVKDYEGDLVNITVDFGDGTDPVAIRNISIAANTPITRNVTHAFEKGRDAAYTITVTVDDGLMPFHSIKEWDSTTVSVSVEPEEKSNLWLYIGIGLVVAVIAALLVLFLLMKRKKGEKKPEAGEGMEGMAPPEPPPNP